MPKPSCLLKQGEAKTLRFNVTNKKTDEAIDLSGSTFFLGVKKYENSTSYTFSKSHSDFTTTLASTGIIDVFISTTNTNQVPGDYIAELKITMPADSEGIPIIKSVNLTITIDKSIIPV